MLSKEEYKKELVRMWDTLREKHKGTHNCEGIESSCKECPLHKCCLNEVNDDPIYNAMEIVELVEQWSKEHPIIINRDKFKKVFGFEVVENFHNCAGIPCPNEILRDEDCNSCPYNGFWNREYKEPKESKEE